MKRLLLLAVLAPALALAIYDMEWFDLNHWKCPFENFGPWGYNPAVGTGVPGGSWPQPLQNFYVFGGGPWVGAISDSPTPETLCTVFYQADSGSEGDAMLCRYWREGNHDSRDRIYKYTGDWPPPSDRFPMAPQQPRSDMEMWCCFSDSNPGEHRAGGRPLGIDIYLTVHGFSDSLAQDFFFLKYELANCSGDSIRHIYFGMLFDPFIGDPADDMTGLILDHLFQAGPDTIRVKNTGYAHDYDSTENHGWFWESGTPGVVAMTLLNAPQSKGLTAFKKFTCPWGSDSMRTDAEQYMSLAGYNYRNGVYDPYDSIDTDPGDKMELLSTGPFDIAPDSVLTFWYVVIASPCDLSELAIRRRRADSIYVRRLIGITETKSDERVTMSNRTTIVRRVFNLQPAISNMQSEPVLLDISGRTVMSLRPGANDVSALSPGIYFVRSEPSAVIGQSSAVFKVAIAR